METTKGDDKETLNMNIGSVYKYIINVLLIVGNVIYVMPKYTKLFECGVKPYDLCDYR